MSRAFRSPSRFYTTFLSSLHHWIKQKKKERRGEEKGRYFLGCMEFFPLFFFIKQDFFEKKCLRGSRNQYYFFHFIDREVGDIYSLYFDGVECIVAVILLHSIFMEWLILRRRELIKYCHYVRSEGSKKNLIFRRVCGFSTRRLEFFRSTGLKEKKKGLFSP